MTKEPTIVKSVGRRNTSKFNCRRNKHYWTDAGGFETDEEDLEGRYEFRWCICCGCLEETKYNLDDAGETEPTVKIRVPDTGI